MVKKFITRSETRQLVINKSAHKNHNIAWDNNAHEWAPPGEFIALQTFNALKEIPFGRWNIMSYMYFQTKKSALCSQKGMRWLPQAKFCSFSLLSVNVYGF